MLGSRSTYTRARILEAAERLFASKGHEKTSLREITAEAGVNLAAVNYHFGSKEGLIQAVHQQQLDSLNQERLAALELLETQAAGNPIEAGRLIDAFFRPLLQHVLRRNEARCPPVPLSEPPLSDPNSFPRALLASHATSATTRFLAALDRTLPGLSRQESLWRYHFMLGACAAAIASMDGLLLALNPLHAEPADLDDLCERLTVFLAGGLTAPPPENPAAFSLRPPDIPGDAGEYCTSLPEP